MIIEADRSQNLLHSKLGNYYLKLPFFRFKSILSMNYLEICMPEEKRVNWKREARVSKDIRNFYGITAVTVMFGSSFALYTGSILPGNQAVFAAVSGLLFVASLLGVASMNSYRLKFLSYAKRAEESAE